MCQVPLNPHGSSIKEEVGAGGRGTAATKKTSRLIIADQGGRFERTTKTRLTG